MTGDDRIPEMKMLSSVVDGVVQLSGEALAPGSNSPRRQLAITLRRALWVIAIACVTCAIAALWWLIALAVRMVTSFSPWLPWLLAGGVAIAAVLLWCRILFARRHARLWAQAMTPFALFARERAKDYRLASAFLSERGGAEYLLRSGFVKLPEGTSKEVNDLLTLYPGAEMPSEMKRQIEPFIRESLVFSDKPNVRVPEGIARRLVRTTIEQHLGPYRCIAIYLAIRDLRDAGFAAEIQRTPRGHVAVVLRERATPNVDWPVSK